MNVVASIHHKYREACTRLHLEAELLQWEPTADRAAYIVARNAVEALHAQAQALGVECLGIHHDSEAA